MNGTQSWIEQRAALVASNDPARNDQEMLWHLCQQAISFRNRARACAEASLAANRRDDQQVMVRAAKHYFIKLGNDNALTVELRALYDEARAR